MGAYQIFLYRSSSPTASVSGGDGRNANKHRILCRFFDRNFYKARTNPPSAARCVSWLLGMESQIIEPL
jgi:hypothetical protein